MCYNVFIIKKIKKGVNMTKSDKEIIKREILLAYLKLSKFKSSVRLSTAISIGLNEAERKIEKEKE